MTDINRINSYRCVDGKGNVYLTYNYNIAEWELLKAQAHKDWDALIEVLDESGRVIETIRDIEMD